MKRTFAALAALAALVAMLLAPTVSNVFASVAARACAAAPCCAGGAHACPMHQKGSQPSCHAHTCRDDASAVQAPPVVAAVPVTIASTPSRNVVAFGPEAAIVPFDRTPPDPPPPRLLAVTS